MIIYLCLNWLQNGINSQLKPYYLLYVSVLFCSQLKANYVHLSMGKHWLANKLYWYFSLDKG